MTSDYTQKLIQLVEQIEEKAKALLNTNVNDEKDLLLNIIYLAGYIQPLKEKMP